MHSNAYNEFIQKVETDGYIQGYNSKLFESILPQERDDVEHIIEKTITIDQSCQATIEVISMNRRRKNGYKFVGKIKVI